MAGESVVSQKETSVCCAHGTKHAYADAPIDYSYWHVAETVKDLHPDDRNNPVWNQDTAKCAADFD